ncbi:response regulator transcription factor [Microbacterium sp. SSM24]|uniref:response regulator transcription factor n=1 Tax=Microbacterium sp. SSM24 TaxID=2991714 RepID=UPI002226B21E|nr:response regulator transcription factor [Microbacterium sp. SSM24]MCW3492917.1 response regulator transcription factor [Microbacterium sp. SSM24]
MDVIEHCPASDAGIARACRDSRARVVIIDVGADATATQAAISVLRSEARARGVVAVAGSGSAEMIVHLFASGVRGVVARDAAPAELLTAVREVSAGNLFASRTAMRLVLEHLVLPDAWAPRRRLLDHEQLSERERDAVGLLVQGMSNQEIARQMFVSAATVKVHLSRAMSKWGVRDRVQLVIRALSTDFAHQDDSI